MSLTNNGWSAVSNVQFGLVLPAGWQAGATTFASYPSVAAGATASVQFTVTAPASAVGGRITATATATSTTGSTSAPVTFVVGNHPPTTPVYLSDLTWTSAASGYGVVQRDHSLGDGWTGGQLKIGSTTYSKGLGTNSPSRIEYSFGGRCTTLAVDVGVDAEVGSAGTVDFQVWGDGVKLYDSGVLAGGQPPVHVTRDLSGAGYSLSSSPTAATGSTTTTPTGATRSSPARSQPRLWFTTSMLLPSS